MCQRVKTDESYIYYFGIFICGATLRGGSGIFKRTSKKGSPLGGFSQGKVVIKNSGGI